MWFKLASATFNTHLGSMASLSNSISIKYTANGFSYTTNSVTKTASSANLVLNLMSGWECKSTPTVSVSGAAVVNGTPTWSNNKLTIAIKPASSKSTFEAAGTIINVSVSGATAISSGGSGGSEPETPDTPSFVDPRLSHPQAKSGATVPSNGIITQDMTTVLEDCWMNGTFSYLSWNPEGSGGESSGTYTDDYFCCYLPVDISQYTKIDITANGDNAAYYQFFTTDLKFTMTGGRIKVDKGTSVTAQAIPDGAKYLVLAHHRIKEGAYSDYYPTTVKLYK